MVVNNPHIQIGDIVKPKYKLIQFKQKYLDILLPNRDKTLTHDSLKRFYKSLCNEKWECIEIYQKSYKIGHRYNERLIIDYTLIPKQLLKKC